MFILMLPENNITSSRSISTAVKSTDTVGIFIQNEKTLLVTSVFSETKEKKQHQTTSKRMLPFDLRDVKTGLSDYPSASGISDGKFPDYLRRLCDFRQMDFEASFDQLLTLLSTEPHRV
jgi:hypothetical protein